MADTEHQIRNRIESFVDELNALVRRAALEAVEEALGGSLGRSARGPRRRASAADLNGAPRASRPRKGGRRTSKQLQKAQQVLLDYIGQHPGERMEQIGEAIHKSTRELRRPLNKLMAKGQIVRQGEKRASRYYLTGSAPKQRAGGKKKRAKR